MEVDLIITVDTMLAHLAGGLGRPVWTLLAFAPDWCWMLDRADQSRPAAPDGPLARGRGRRDDRLPRGVQGQVNHVIRARL